MGVAVKRLGALLLAPVAEKALWPAAVAVSAAPPPSALGSLLSLSQSQQLGVSRQPSAGDQSAARCRPVSGSAARRQIPNPALLHQQSQGRLTVLNVPPAEAAGTGSVTVMAATMLIVSVPAELVTVSETSYVPTAL